MIKIALASLFVLGGVAAFAAKLDSRGPLNETKRGYVIHTVESAPAASKPYLEWVNGLAGFVPNLSGIMAESPALANTYWKLQVNLQEKGSLTPAEDNIVQMAIAVENECQYCVAGGTLAGKMFFGSSDAELQALRTSAKLPKAKFDALRDFSVAVYEAKGRVTDAQLQAFLDAGYTRTQSLDVVANVAAKVMTNYTNQLALTPLDEPLKPLAEGLPFQESREIVRRD